MLFVRLRQFHPDDRERVAIDTPSAEWFPGIARGIAEEIFVLDGAIEDEEGRYAAGSWLCNPPSSQHAPFSLEGCLLYVKIGHLPAVVI